MALASGRLGCDVKAADLLAWFDEIAATQVQPVFAGPDLSIDANKWIADASSALNGAFPTGHRIHQEWQRAAEAGERQTVPARATEARWNAMRGVFASGHAQLKAGRIASFVDSIRAETEDEVLDQANAFLKDGHLVPATVLAGGALEVHLKRLCDKNNLTAGIAGPLSIDKYNTAIAQARNNGLTIYEKVEQSQVTSWGQLRNEAAHDPITFQQKRTKPEVQPMIDNIRAFIARIQ